MRNVGTQGRRSETQLQHTANPRTTTVFGNMDAVAGVCFAATAQAPDPGLEISGFRF